MPIHEPVLLVEAVEWLAPQRGGLFVDCTVGAGGHTNALLEAGATHVVGLDRDRAALRVAARALAHWGDRVELVHGDFRELPAILDARGIAAIDGALADLGVSSMQLDEEGRGFSFRRDEALDMRMDQQEGPTAADLIAELPERELADAIWRYGEERHARRVARAIDAARRSAPIVSTGQLAAIVRRSIPRSGGRRIDPATRTFQALRILVNRELEGLEAFLTAAARRLRAGARLVVIAFHSLEDRIVKHTFRTLAAGAERLGRVLTRRPVMAGASERAANPRARSAKLRAFERLT